MYDSVLDKIDLEDDKKIELLDYITKTYKNDIDYVEYRNDLIKYISFNKELPVIEEKKSIEEIFKDLNDLVGLDKVKKVLYDLVDVIKLKEKTKDIKINDMNLHMVFLGNPGTGKTTIARIISSILYNLGYIKENKLVEVSTKDLVGQYVGQTAPKTMSVIEKSMNGVLFIDEAYTLAVKGDNTYNAEAIATLIQAMENYRDKLVVIFAGYTKEMKDFLNSNSGIVSRIGYTLEFEDYTTEELIKIFEGFATKNGFIVDSNAIEYLKTVIDENRNSNNFGNARFVRNIYEKTVIKHATNVKDKKQSKVLKTITKNDISIENLNFE
jgi:AAA+ superfamily predicted ATPase